MRTKVLDDYTNFLSSRFDVTDIQKNSEAELHVMVQKLAGFLSTEKDLNGGLAGYIQAMTDPKYLSDKHTGINLSALKKLKDDFVNSGELSIQRFILKNYKEVEYLFRVNGCSMGLSVIQMLKRYKLIEEKTKPLSKLRLISYYYDLADVLVFNEAKTAFQVFTFKNEFLVDAGLSMLVHEFVLDKSGYGIMYLGRDIRELGRYGLVMSQYDYTKI